MLCYRRPWITKKIQVNLLIHGYINAPDRFGTHLHVSVKLSISFLEDTWLSCESLVNLISRCLQICTYH
jgi:hypothetical protein